MANDLLRERFPDLLTRLGSSFDVAYRVSRQTLADHFERIVGEALAEPERLWGEPGDRVRLDSVTDGALTFLYRPHLFPGMDDTLRLGHLVQFHSLPRRLPEGAPVTVAAMLESYCHLSGDLFGWRETGDGGFLVWLVDTSGHGVRAGFASLVLRLLLEEIDPLLPLADLLAELERRFLKARNPADRRPLYATGLFLRFTADGAVRYLSAGHPPMLVRRAGREVRDYQPTCVPVGLLPPMNAKALPVALSADDVVLLCTDGVPEAGDADGRPFGGERLRRELAAAEGGLSQIAGSIYAALAQHHDLTRLDDDLTFLLLRRNEAGLPGPTEANP